jgi:hypothetical protein
MLGKSRFAGAEHHRDVFDHSATALLAFPKGFDSDAQTVPRRDHFPFEVFPGDDREHRSRRKRKPVTIDFVQQVERDERRVEQRQNAARQETGEQRGRKCWVPAQAAGA